MAGRNYSGRASVGWDCGTLISTFMIINSLYCEQCVRMDGIAHKKSKVSKTQAIFSNTLYHWQTTRLRAKLWSTSENEK